MRRLLLGAAIAMLSALTGPTAAVAGVTAKVVAKIDLSRQRMNVYLNGYHQYSWKVSTGAGRYRTPTGSYRPKFLSRKHFSSKYDNAPMPFSVFYHRGYAVHGTYSIRRLGRPASHGCVRLHPANAAKLFNLVRRYGKQNSRIVIVR